MFVGRPDARLAKAITDRVRGTKGSAAIMVANRSEMGFSIELIQWEGLTVADFDGLRLVVKKGKRKSAL